MASSAIAIMTILHDQDLCQLHSFLLGIDPSLENKKTSLEIDLYSKGIVIHFQSHQLAFGEVSGSRLLKTAGTIPIYTITMGDTNFFEISHWIKQREIWITSRKIDRGYGLVDTYSFRSID